MSNTQTNFLIDLSKKAFQMLSAIRKQFGINKNETMNRLVPNLIASASEIKVDPVIYISNWIEKALSGAGIYGKGVIMLGQDSVLSA